MLVVVVVAVDGVAVDGVAVDGVAVDGVAIDGAGSFAIDVCVLAMDAVVAVVALWRRRRYTVGGEKVCRVSLIVVVMVLTTTIPIMMWRHSVACTRRHLHDTGELLLLVFFVLILLLCRGRRAAPQGTTQEPRLAVKGIALTENERY